MYFYTDKCSGNNSLIKIYICTDEVCDTVDVSIHSFKAFDKQDGGRICIMCATIHINRKISLRWQTAPG